MTGARIYDCVHDDDGKRIIFIVKTGHLGLAIGKNGKKINQVRQLIGREVEIVEYNSDPKIFVRNCLSPARVKNVTIGSRRDGTQFLNVTVDPKDRGLAIGKAGKTIIRARLLVQRHFGIQHVTIE